MTIEPDDIRRLINGRCSINEAEGDRSAIPEANGTARG
jgi:hypothetical protein